MKCYYVTPISTTYDRDTMVSPGILACWQVGMLHTSNLASRHVGMKACWHVGMLACRQVGMLAFASWGHQ